MFLRIFPFDSPGTVTKVLCTLSHGVPYAVCKYLMSWYCCITVGGASCSSSSDHRAGPAIRLNLFLHINDSESLSCWFLLAALELGPASGSTTGLLLACLDCCLSSYHPVRFVVDAWFHEVIIVHLQQKSAIVRYVVYVGVSELIYLFHDFVQFFSSQPSLLFVTKCEIPENPLAVCYVQYFADKLPDLLFSIYSVIPQDKVLILDVIKMSWDPSFHEVLPAYDVLVFSQSRHLWRHTSHLCHLLGTSH